MAGAVLAVLPLPMAHPCGRRDSANPGTAPPRDPPVYKQRHPEKAAFYAVLSRYFDEFARIYDERYERTYGGWRSVIERVVRKYLDRGIPLRGFARIKCGSCREEAILPFSCKQRAFCPSCTAKRAAAWAGLMREEVLQPYPHHHVVFSMPKMLRPYFRFHRELLPELCGCGWAALRTHLLIPSRREPSRLR